MNHPIFLFFLLGAACLQAAPSGSAFPGLRVIESLPSAHTSQVVELRGMRGTPQPSEWIVLLHDSSARGGVRELTLVNGQIASERTPLHPPPEVAGLVPVDPAKLKCDSDEVFRTIQREAERGRIGFDGIDYTLRTDPESKAPVWSVTLSDQRGVPLATMRISAESGSIVRPLRPEGTVHQKEAPARVLPVGGLVGTVGNAAVDTANKTKDSVLHFVGTLQEVFVGKRTIGPKEEE